jgi:hypothetical protein
MVLVGPSLGAAVAIDFSINHPEAVHALTNFVLYISLLQCSSAEYTDIFVMLPLMLNLTIYLRRAFIQDISYKFGSFIFQ